MKKIAFLDRDGVINIERGEYTFKVEDFELHPELIPFLKELQKREFQFVMISNQGGIAKGIYEVGDVEACHEKLKEVLAKENLHFLDFFFSPHHSEIGNSIDRKPDSLMLERAIYRHGVDIGKSFLIGDSERDIFAAEKVGLKGIKIEANASLLACLDEIDDR